MRLKTTYGSDNEGGLFLMTVEVRLNKKELTQLRKTGRLKRERDYFANNETETTVVLRVR